MGFRHGWIQGLKLGCYLSAVSQLCSPLRQAPLNKDGLTIAPGSLPGSLVTLEKENAVFLRIPGNIPGLILSCLGWSCEPIALTLTIRVTSSTLASGVGSALSTCGLGWGGMVSQKKTRCWSQMKGNGCWTDRYSRCPLQGICPSTPAFSTQWGKVRVLLPGHPYQNQKNLISA